MRSKTSVRTRFLISVIGIGLLAASGYAQHSGREGHPHDSKAPMLKDEYADVNGVKLHYVTAGKGKLIMFVHGFPEFWYEWKNQLLEFGRDHLAVAPDMRGYNLSSKPAELSAYAVPQLVEDVRALMAELSKDVAGSRVLVAHDWGGAIAWVFAALHPELVDKLVI